MARFVVRATRRVVRWERAELEVDAPNPAAARDMAEARIKGGVEWEAFREVQTDSAEIEAVPAGNDPSLTRR